jgi:hypothetical protein
MAVSFTQNSCSIEGIMLADTEEIWNLLRKNYNLDDWRNVEQPLPTPDLLLEKPENVIEIRNHLLATHSFCNMLHELEHEIGLDDVKELHRIML